MKVPHHILTSFICPTGKARIITVEKTRNLLNDLYRTGHQGSKKVAIIYEVDRMRKEAANAFLKTLEEPPPGTYLVLLTTAPTLFYRLFAAVLFWLDWRNLP